MSQKIQDLTEDALDVFWYFIAKHFPEAKYGDLSPLTTIRLIEAAKSAVNEWIWANVPRGRRKKTAQRSRACITHSPGPWFVDRESPHSAICIKPYPGCIVCDVRGTDAEAEANARLLAAAPELLAACERICGLIGRDKNDSETIDLDQYEKAESACRSAIAKANGVEADTGREAV